MKYLLFYFIVFVLFFSRTATSDEYKFYPNLPSGEYRAQFKGIIRCIPPPNNKMQWNFYLSKKSATSTEIKGNATYMMPLDDSFSIEANMAVKDSIGGWKDNAFLLKSPKACTTIKHFAGNVWSMMMEGLRIQPSCPIPAGTYISPGLDTDLYRNVSLSKIFFYGTYKLRIMLSKNKENYGCIVLVVEVKRPWEKD